MQEIPSVLEQFNTVWHELEMRIRGLEHEVQASVPFEASQLLVLTHCPAERVNGLLHRMQEDESVIEQFATVSHEPKLRIRGLGHVKQALTPLEVAQLFVVTHCPPESVYGLLHWVQIVPLETEQFEARTQEPAERTRGVVHVEQAFIPFEIAQFCVVTQFPAERVYGLTH